MSSNERLESFDKERRQRRVTHELQTYRNNSERANLFESFSEVSFKAHGTYGLRNDFHMYMGDFRHYLETAG